MRKSIAFAALFIVGVPLYVFARGTTPDINQKVQMKGLGKEYFFGQNVPVSSSQAAFVAAVNQEHLNGGGTVHVVSETPISSAVTVPSDVKVIVEHGARFTKVGGGTLTFEGPVEVTDSSAFYGFVGAGVDGGASDLVFSTAHATPQGIRIQSPAVMGSTSELLIEGNASEPVSGAYLNIIAHGLSNLPDGRPLFRVDRSGGVGLWDYLMIGGGGGCAVGDFRCSPANGAMLAIGSDLTVNGTNMVMWSGAQHNDFLGMADSDGADYDHSSRRFSFSAAGVLAFGAKVAGVPALKPSGAELQVRTGNDSTYADLRAGNLLANSTYVQGPSSIHVGSASYNYFVGSDAAATTVTGTPGDGASAVSVILDSVNPITTAGGKQVSVRNAGTEKANFDRNGQLQIGIGNTSACDTCAAGIRGQICYVGGGAGVKDSAAICAKDAGNAYAWRTIY